MKAPDFYLNNYIADELRAAFDKEDVCISYSGDYEPETLNQVHNSCEILFVEEGEAEYQVNDTVYHVEKNTVLIIGATDRHKFTFTKLPYIRYGLTLMPSFLQSLPIVSGYMNVYQTQIPENAAKLVNLEPSVFQRMIKILWELRDEWESGEEGSDCALLQTFEDQWIRVFANTPEYQDRVCHKVDKQHGANQDCQQLSIFGEDRKTIGGHGIEHQTKDTEWSKADDPCNYLGQRFGYIVQHILAGLACCTHTDTDQNSPEQNTDVVCIYKGVDGVGNDISKQCA